VELIFKCDVDDQSTPQLPTHPDPHQVAIRWIPVTELGIVPLQPKIDGELCALLQHMPKTPTFYENPSMR